MAGREREEGRGSGGRPARGALADGGKGRSRRRDGVLGSDRGFVTAESAVVLPVLVTFAMALVWGLLVVAAQIQCVDAARTGARAAARQEPEAAVIKVAGDVAPRGAKVTVAREGAVVRVVVVARPPVLRGLPFEVREEAVAAAEEMVGVES
ncbi:TadE family type IV pilus minor pilin [Streptomyces nigra]|uniref:TadE family type IV pilus minor pilin n=1 Tax=Streptomyces nigra TaxID=1827580 RepID=UPI003F510730